MTDLGPSPISIEEAVSRLAMRQPLRIKSDLPHVPGWPDWKPNRHAIGEDGILVLGGDENPPMMLQHIADVIVRVSEGTVTVTKRRLPRVSDDYQAKRERAVENVMARFGLGGALTHNTWKAMRRSLVLLVTPQHEISGPWTVPGADDPVDVRLEFAIASAIEEAAQNARDDWTHIDCPARAGVIVRQFLPQIEESLKVEVAKGLGLDTRNRTQRLMARAKERRRG